MLEFHSYFCSWRLFRFAMKRLYWDCLPAWAMERAIELHKMTS